MRLIDANALIDLIERMKPYHQDADDIVEMIYNMPSSQSELKTGEWLLHTYIPHRNYCSCCKKDSPYDHRWDFCPNCGAFMEEE